MALLEPFFGSHAIAVNGSPTLVVPVGTIPGDLMIIVGLARNANFSLPAGWTALRSASGSSETDFTSPLVCYRIAPNPVPATVVLTPAPSFNSMGALAIYKGGLVHYLDSRAAIFEKATTSVLNPGNITLPRAGKVVLVCASNSGDNTQQVLYGAAGGWVARSNVTSGARIQCSIFEIDVPAGTTDLPALTMNRSEPRFYMAFPIYNKQTHEVVTY